jgi:hypothetical protein
MSLKKLFRLWAVLVSFLPAALATPSSHVYVVKSMHISGSVAFPVPLIAPRALCAGRALYRQPTWAISIESVSCDGRNIPSEPDKTLFDEPDFSSMISDADFVYMIWQRRLRFGQPKADGGYSLYSYRLPDDFRELRIRYRIAFPDGSKSSAIEFTSTEVDMR